MQSHKTQFLELALELGALRFGEFELKSGRISPYFFNAGELSTGRAAASLGRCYAAALADTGIAFDMLFGPAYKGISLVALTAAALAEHHGLDCPYAYNRKERKGHGEGGVVDRQEVATGSSRSAVRELADQLSVPVLSIVSLEDLVTHMQAHPAFAQHLPAMRAYRERYGAK